MALKGGQGYINKYVNKSMNMQTRTLIINTNKITENTELDCLVMSTPYNNSVAASIDYSLCTCNSSANKI